MMKLLKSILYVASPTNDDDAVLDRAVALASNNQATLTVVGVVNDVANSAIASRYSMDHLQEIMIEQCREALLEKIADHSSSKLIVEVKVLVGRIFMEVIREAIAQNHDMVIKKAEANSAPIFGSTDQSLLRNCPCPVWIVKSTEVHGQKEIVAALDYAPDNQEVDTLNGQILRLASSLALAEFAELHIVHAWHLAHESFLRSGRVSLSTTEVDELAAEEKTQRTRWLDETVEKNLLTHEPDAAKYLKPTLHLRKGNAREVVPELIEDLGAELVVMGTVGRTGISGFIIGNTAETILNRIDCSVLAVKPDGFISNVTEK